MNTVYYAGIGSRKTPHHVLETMNILAQLFAKHGMVLRSGAAVGADQAFEQGCDAVGGQKEIFIPWQGFCNRQPTESGVYWCRNPRAAQIAELIHPNWKACSSQAQAFHQRNTHQIMGIDLSLNVKFVVCWAPVINGAPDGGTAQAIRLAKRLGIPVINMWYPTWQTELSTVLKEVLGV